MVRLPVFIAARRVCSLGPVAAITRLREFGDFVRRASAAGPIADGVRLDFEPNAANRAAILGFIQTESACCARFTYRVIDDAERSLALEVAASEGDLPALRRMYLANR